MRDRCTVDLKHLNDPPAYKCLEKFRNNCRAIFYFFCKLTLILKLGHYTDNKALFSAPWID